MSTLLLFDVDGTLTTPRKKIDNSMLNMLTNIHKNEKYHIGFVGGSDLIKQKEQLGEENFNLFRWRFSENGLLAYHNEQCIHKKSFVEEFTEKHHNRLINICLQVLSMTACPVKRGTFIEYRNGMLNISPIGRACNQDERDEFEKYDSIHNIRKTMISQIRELWKSYVKEEHLNHLPELNFSIGGQISIDIFPKGWDKTYCLQFIDDKYKKIHFFGDKTHKGGNDYEIYQDRRVIGHKVNTYEDTIEILKILKHE